MIDIDWYVSRSSWVLDCCGANFLEPSFGRQIVQSLILVQLLRWRTWSVKPLRELLWQVPQSSVGTSQHRMAMSWLTRTYAMPSPCPASGLHLWCLDIVWYFQDFQGHSVFFVIFCHLQCHLGSIRTVLRHHSNGENQKNDGWSKVYCCAQWGHRRNSAEWTLYSKRRRQGGLWRRGRGEGSYGT